MLKSVGTLTRLVGPTCMRGICPCACEADLHMLRVYVHVLRVYMHVVRAYAHVFRAYVHVFRVYACVACVHMHVRHMCMRACVKGQRTPRMYQARTKHVRMSPMHVCTALVLGVGRLCCVWGGRL